MRLCVCTFVRLCVCAFAFAFACECLCACVFLEVSLDLASLTMSPNRDTTNAGSLASLNYFMKFALSVRIHLAFSPGSQPSGVSAKVC